MNLIENKTKFTHKTMSSWGIGIYRKADGAYINVEFETVGLKKFNRSAINSILLPVIEKDEIRTNNVKQIEAKVISGSVNKKKARLVQFDGEIDKIAGKNVIEAFMGEDSVIFNETYIVLGEHTKALKIHAMYDLTIIGNITVQECVVNGSLTVIGEAHVSNLTCYNDLICKGNLYADKIYVGGDMNVESIVCDEMICDGNVVLKTTANINQCAQINKTIIACEGIMGAGTFSAVNAIANEYFEFDGKYEGKILELEMDTTICDTKSNKGSTCETIEECIDLLNRKISDEYKKCSELDETEIIEHLKGLGEIQSHGFKVLPIVEPLFNKLTEISYQERIETVDEYLMVLMAQQMLPTEIYNYEAVDHIDKLFLPKARESIDELCFEPCTIEQFSRTLSMAVKFEEELSPDWETLMDKIFESVGLKYVTVNSMLERNYPKKNEEVISETENTEEKEEKIIAVSDGPQINKEEFLAKKLSQMGKKMGLTDVELERMATIKVRTLGDLTRATDNTLTKVFGKKAFLAKHLIEVKNKIIEKIADME